MIHDVIVKRLKVVPDERGRLMEIMRNDDPFFRKFGQVYLTTNYPGVVKAWHFHKKQDDHVCCVSGMIKLVIYDGREESATRGEINEFFMGPHNPVLVKIPALCHHGWKCISENESLVLSVPSEAYDYQHPDEYRVAPHGGGIPYDWSRKDG